MKNTIGDSFAITIFGESHGEYIGCVIDGLAAGIKLDLAKINHDLTLRRPAGVISTSRIENDDFKIISGYFNGYTTGSALTIIIPNANTRSKDYESLKYLPRPSHADYAANMKYHGYQDYRGGGHFSGRLTAALVIAGSIAKQILEKHNILVGSHIQRLAGIDDELFANNPIEQIKAMNDKLFAVLDNNKGDLMVEAIKNAVANKDSVGGIIETAVVGMPEGIGEPWFDTVEGILGKMIFSVPAVKGIEFGAGFKMSDLKGSEANDPFAYEHEKVITLSNNSGGINGGITNGMPIIIHTAIKPTASIAKPQKTVDLIKKENAILEISGRHDPAIVHRAVVAIGLVDICSMHYGTDWQRGKDGVRTDW